MAKVSTFPLRNFKRKPVIEKYKLEKSDLNSKHAEFCIKVSAVMSETLTAEKIISKTYLILYVLVRDI